MEQRKKHLIFVDWMKVIGMYAIILGHFTPPILKYLTYSFSVQLFFFISGFLFHVEKNNKVFWRKNIRLLVIPYFIWGIIRLITYNIKENNVQTLYHSFAGLMLGCNNFMGARGCGELWFIATLFWLKVFAQHVALPIKRLIEFTAASLILATVYRHLICSTTIEYNGIGSLDSFVAFPFFALGMISSMFRDKIISLVDKMKLRAKELLLCTVAAFVILALVSQTNGVVLMVYGQYGNNLLFYLLLGVMGIFSVFMFSILLSRLSNLSECAKTINIGSIVILGLHTLFVNKAKVMLECIEISSFVYEISLVITSFIILVLFIPLTKVANRFIPVSLGKRKI